MRILVGPDSTPSVAPRFLPSHVPTARVAAPGPRASLPSPILSARVSPRRDGHLHGSHVANGAPDRNNDDDEVGHSRVPTTQKSLVGIATDAPRHRENRVDTLLSIQRRYSANGQIDRNTRRRELLYCDRIVFPILESIDIPLWTFRRRYSLSCRDCIDIRAIYLIRCVHSPF